MIDSIMKGFMTGNDCSCLGIIRIGVGTREEAVRIIRIERIEDIRRTSSSIARSVMKSLIP